MSSPELTPAKRAASGDGDGTFKRDAAAKERPRLTPRRCPRGAQPRSARALSTRHRSPLPSARHRRMQQQTQVLRAQRTALKTSRRPPRRPAPRPPQLRLSLRLRLQCCAPRRRRVRGYGFLATRLRRWPQPLRRRCLSRRLRRAPRCATSAAMRGRGPPTWALAQRRGSQCAPSAACGAASRGWGRTQTSRPRSCPAAPSDTRGDGASEAAMDVRRFATAHGGEWSPSAATRCLAVPRARVCAAGRGRQGQRHLLASHDAADGGKSSAATRTATARALACCSSVALRLTQTYTTTTRRAGRRHHPTCRRRLTIRVGGLC